jgi:CBS domain containing-hemolysin-like protein
MIADILITTILVLLNGFFVAAEFAIVKVRQSQIELKANQGNSVAKVAMGILNNMDGYLSACQLGITLASLALGWIGEPRSSEYGAWIHWLFWNGHR